jgi:alpha-beta hydrolase superfamily lysophospholipase
MKANPAAPFRPVGRKRWREFMLAAFLTLSAAAMTAGGCAPTTQRLGPLTTAPSIERNNFVMADGAELPFRSWGDPGKARAIIVALHGFNDYSKSWEMPGAWWAERGLFTVAYDQRGFGAGPRPGIFPAEGVLVRDLETVVALLRADNPGIPLYLVGESMGSAVAMLAVADGLKVDGVVLGAPAVWGWSTMNPFYSAGLRLLAHTVPHDHVTGSGLGIVACDNRDVLIAMSRDPLVIKETRVDAVYALVSLMEQASKTAPLLPERTLLLYGDHDEVVPAEAIESLRKKLPDWVTFDLVPNGYHMLYRDLNAETVWRDVETWITGDGGQRAASP